MWMENQKFPEWTHPFAIAVYARFASPVQVDTIEATDHKGQYELEEVEG